jgi:flagellar basal body rod protein FlgG
MDALDRLASDIANAGTAGYKAERAGTTEANRPSFGAVLESAVDVANGPAKLDLRPGPLASTGRSLDLAIQGSGFFVLDTPAGTRYTRNGHLVRRADGVLATEDGNAVQGTSGVIRLGLGNLEVDADGTVRSDGGVIGTLKVVEFDSSAQLVREGGSRFRVAGQPRVVARPSIATGSLEQSNASMAERAAELSQLSRSFETLLRAVSVLMNDVDKGAISELGRR